MGKIVHSGAFLHWKNLSKDEVRKKTIDQLGLNI